MSREKEAEFGRRTDDALDLQTPLGWRLKVKGSVAIIVILLLGLGYIVWRHDEASKEATTAVISAINESVYIQTLTEAEKKQLRLAMPVTMRERMLKQERDLRGVEFRRQDQ